MDDPVHSSAALDEAPLVTGPRDDPEASDRAETPTPGDAGQLPLAARIEALLVSTDRPLGDARLAELLGLRGKGAASKISQAIAALNDDYEKSGRAFRIERVAGGWQVLTLATFGPLLAALHADRLSSRLSQAALETLSIIAYRQPILRAEIEAIRGVASGEVLRGLLERRLVKIVGRAEELGRPMLYGTTREFLKVFGLSSLEDLPTVEGLERRPTVAMSPEPPADEAGPAPAPPGEDESSDPPASDESPVDPSA